MSPPKGLCRQSWLTVVTTSTCPCSSSGGASPRPFTRATRLGRPGALSYRAHSMPASPSTRSMSSTATCSSPGGLVVSRRMRSRVSSTTKGNAATSCTLTDRGLFEPARNGRLEQRVAVEARVGLANALHLGANLVDEGWLFQCPHGHVRHAVLARAQQLTHPPQPHVLACELESVADRPHELEALLDRVGRIVGQQQAVARRGAPADPAAKLMQLGQPEPVCAFHHHHGGIGHIHSDL